jgi:hypothetical protein
MYDSPVVKGSFTAPEGYIEFLREIGGEKTVSAGVRLAVETLVSQNHDYYRLMLAIKNRGYDVGKLSDVLNDD